MPSSERTSAAWVATCCSEMAFCAGQRLIARQIHLGVGEIGLVARQLALRLVERRLIGARIDLGEQVARLHHLAFGEIELDQHAADLRPHRGGGQRRHRAQRIERDIDGRIAAAVATPTGCGPWLKRALTGGLGIDRPDQQRQQRQSPSRSRPPATGGDCRRPSA